MRGIRNEQKNNTSFLNDLDRRIDAIRSQLAEAKEFSSSELLDIVEPILINILMSLRGSKNVFNNINFAFSERYFSVILIDKDNPHSESLISVEIYYKNNETKPKGMGYLLRKYFYTPTNDNSYRKYDDKPGEAVAIYINTELLIKNYRDLLTTSLHITDPSNDSKNQYKEFVNLLEKALIEAAQKIAELDQHFTIGTHSLKKHPQTSFVSHQPEKFNQINPSHQYPG